MEQTTRLYEDLQRCPASDSGWRQIYDRFVARLTALEAAIPRRAPEPASPI